MVIDTSALLAMLLNEPESDQMIAGVQRDQRRLISAVQLLESAIVIEARKGAAGGREAEGAREAWRRWARAGIRRA
jgi:ribonuclease VapC